MKPGYNCSLRSKVVRFIIGQATNATKQPEREKIYIIQLWITMTFQYHIGGEKNEI